MASISIRPIMRSAFTAVGRASCMSGNKPLLIVAARRSISTQSVTPAEAEDILIKQRSVRPVSPHLTIYKPQVTWVLSGFHRITGVALAAGFYGVGLTYAFGPLLGYAPSSAAIASAFGALPFAAKFAVKFLISAPFTFHAYNGVRHLIWDTGAQLSKKAVVNSGMAVLVLTAISSVGLAFM
ncbi:hypothetical protein V1512DRAFT_9002 [Lipomyces arxii]|uniref:uncharacterized protein n=1 Tax=Lipomyces arxii TaxID=56418 RepID=UPI0034CE5194